MAHNKLISKNDEQEWIYMWSTMPIMPAYWAICESKERPDIYANTQIFSYFDGSVITAYVPQKSIEKHKKESKKFLDPEFYKKYLRNYNSESKIWWKWIRDIEKRDYSMVNKVDLKKDHIHYALFARDSMAYFGSTRPEFTYAVEQELEVLIKKYYKTWPQIFALLTTACELDDIQKESLDWLRVIESKYSDKDLLKHASNYPWLVFGQYDDKGVLRHLNDRAKVATATFKKEFYRLEKEKNELSKEQRMIFNKFGKDAKKGRYLARFLQNQSVLRMSIKSYWAGSYYLTRGLWQKIAKFFKININDLMAYVTPPEIDKMLSGHFDGDIFALIKDRKVAHALDVEKDQIRILESKSAKRLFSKRVKKGANNSAEVKGQTAMLGKVIGAVRKIIPGDLKLLQKSMSKFKKGEILVTSMTQPNMMIIAQKAAAIIADEGGITSHAAIISRELKIPCIVGCLRSMQIFNDGDLVEVDAERGVVKIVK